MIENRLTHGRLPSRVRAACSTRALLLAVTSFIPVAICAPAPAIAQQADLSRCLAITDIAQRVQCYDAIAQSQSRSVEAAPAPPPAPGAEPSAPLRAEQADRRATAAAQSAPQSAPQSALPTFGLSAAQREAQRNPAEREADELSASVSTVRQVGAGYWRFELSDGTTWELTEARRNFRIPRVGDGISIRRGSLGAFYLDADNQPAIRIRRVV